jgi:hypothetical protein
MFVMHTINQTRSPILKPIVTEESYERAVQAKSSACLVADAIKTQYPQFSNIRVDVATIRLTDKKRGVRYMYLTPASVAEALLFFDQGWREEKLPKTFVIRQAVRITPIIRSKSNLKLRTAQSAARLAELETKEQKGDQLTRDEKRSLTVLRKRKDAPVRPTTYGKSRNEVVGNDAVLIGGNPVKYPKRQENLLDDRIRHFGAKHAKPNEVLAEALKEAERAGVEKGVKKERARLKRKGGLA